MSTFGKIGAKRMLFRRRTADEYVQNGLVALWDGVENAGWGVHDTNAELWKDLTGNGFDATFPSLSDREIGNDFVYYGDTQKVNVAARCLLDSEKWSLISNGYTVEVVFSLKTGKTMADTRPYQAYSGLFSRNGGPDGVTWDVFSDRYRFGHKQQPSGVTDYLLYDTSAPIVNLNSGGIMSLTRVCTTTDYAMAMSGEIVKQASGTYAPVAALRGMARHDTLMLGAGGGQVGYNRNIAYMRVHCIRMYNRALTANEISYNNVVDKGRFNLP